jgi:hypothetical protein
MAICFNVNLPDTMFIDFPGCQDPDISSGLVEELLE